MPCSDGNPEVFNALMSNDRDWQNRMDRMARFLCHACSLLSQYNIDPGQELETWYENHIEEDRIRARESKARLAKETALKNRKKYLKSVKMRLLTQLDEDEREALGL